MTSSLRNNIGNGKFAIQQKECTFCFRRKTCKMGLFYSSDDVTSVCFDHIPLYESMVKFPSKKYLNYKEIKKPKKVKTNEEMPKKLAINHSSGFNVTNEDLFDLERKIYNSSTQTFTEFDPFSKHGLEEVSTLLHISPDYYSINLSKHISSWDGSTKEIYPNAHNLFQIPNPPKVNLDNPICQKCDKTENLWLNLSDGTILCGRKYFDGSGGNNHAVEHFEETKYPLSVKLGTITSNGSDVFSYENDEMVMDPYLSSHLKHLGIKIEDLTKTEKTQMELEIELNKKGFKQQQGLQEPKNKLKKSNQYTGLANIGNTCYMASVLQCISQIDSLQKLYHLQFEDIFRSPNIVNANEDFNCQFSKIMKTLCSHTDLENPVDEDGWIIIEPSLFKLAIGNSNSIFITNQQQDASEFLMHLASQIDKCSPLKLYDPLVDMRYHLIECIKKSAKVDKRVLDGYILDLDINEKYENEAKLTDLLNSYTFPECIDYPKNSEIINLMKTNKFCYLPKMLCICIKRFKLSKNMSPIKMKTKIRFPNKDINSVIDIGCLLAEKHEVEDTLNSSEQVEEVLNTVESLNEEQKNILNELKTIGFTDENLCISLILKGLDVESCITSLIQAQEDPSSINQQQSTADAQKYDLKPLSHSNVTVSDEYVNMLVEMGYDRIAVIDTLKLCDNSIELAAEKLMNDPEATFLLDKLATSHSDKNSKIQHKNELTLELLQSSRDRSSNYRLKAFIVHSGNSVNHGHYIAYVKLPNRLDNNKETWFQFNDEKVFQCGNPPFKNAYLYFFENI